ncbi:hypothetical protein TNIN_464071 [Trichonephila inaurata madagascariensis]|uniref:Uncharacterized protein n=1 Tax=Trichonephila inaurata madagascariensis TaxID=2747483 RepID=A0A8X7BXB9_9ARAC|nr:hypothetical protein TNIN_464071 [Trichonephila inaurata madagascariensis]
MKGLDEPPFSKSLLECFTSIRVGDSPKIRKTVVHLLSIPWDRSSLMCFFVTCLFLKTGILCSCNPESIIEGGRGRFAQIELLAAILN